MTSEIRWRVIMAGRPLGLADEQLDEFTAPDKRAAVAELERRQDRGDYPRGAIVVSALQHELYQGDHARRIRAKELARQERLRRFGHGRRRSS